MYEVAEAFKAPEMGDAWKQYKDDIVRLSRKYDVDPNLVESMMRAESGGKKLARSKKGATGLMQLMPATAKAMGVKDLNDPVQNLEGGIKYLKRQLDAQDGNVELALAAYNAGPGNVRKYGGIPPFPETQRYVKKISSFYNEKRPDKLNDYSWLKDLNPDTGRPQGSYEAPPVELSRVP